MFYIVIGPGAPYRVFESLDTVKHLAKINPWAILPYPTRQKAQEFLDDFSRPDDNRQLRAQLNDLEKEMEKNSERISRINRLWAEDVKTHFEVKEELRQSRETICRLQQELFEVDFAVLDEDHVTTCTICLQARKNRAFPACGHTFCESCAARFVRDRKCPNCRRKVTCSIKIHL